jgi:signal peptidase I
MFFHGGSRERALALRHAEQVAREAETKIEGYKRKAKSEAQTEAIKNGQKVINNTFAAVAEMRARPTSDPKTIAADIKRATEEEAKVQAAVKAVVGKPLTSHGPFGGWLSLVGALAAAIALRMFIIEPYQIPSGSMIPTLLVGDHLFVSKLSYGIMNPFSRQPSYLVRWSTPEPGQVVVFEAPSYVGHNAGETWIKRVIARPGQTVRIENTVVYVDGKPYPHIIPDEMVRYKDYESSGIQGRFFGESGDGVWQEREGVYTIEQIGDVKHSIYQRPEGKRIRFETSWPGLFGGPYEGLECEVDLCRVKDGYVFVMGDNRGYSSDGRFWGALPLENIKGRALFIWMSVDGSDSSISFGRFALPGFRWSRWFNAIH